MLTLTAAARPVAAATRSLSRPSTRSLSRVAAPLRAQAAPEGGGETEGEGGEQAAVARTSARAATSPFVSDFGGLAPSNFGSAFARMEAEMAALSRAFGMPAFELPTLPAPPAGARALAVDIQVCLDASMHRLARCTHARCNR